MGQLSFWSADARPRALSDLEGLLCGPGRAELFGRGSAARLTIVLGPEPEPADDECVDGACVDGECADDGCADDGCADGERVDDGREQDDGTAGGEDPDDAPEPAPGIEDGELDLDELAFLDLDPDEIAARLTRAGGSSGAHREPGRRGVSDAAPSGGPVTVPAAEPTVRPGPGVSLPRACGDPGVRRQRCRIARTGEERTGARTDGDDPLLTWRVRALCCALRARGVPAEVGRTGDGRPEVRTAFRADLVGLARAWTCGGGMKHVPEGFELDGPRLRLWVLAAGTLDGTSYTLGLDPDAPGTGDRLLTASRHAGLGATLAGAARTPVLRIVGRRRHGRLGELLGRPPRDLADGVWPV